MTKSNNRKLTIGFTKPGDPFRTLGTVYNRTMPWGQLAKLLTEARQDSVTMDEFLALPKKEQSRRKNTAGAFTGGRFADTHRHAASLEYRSVISLDIDEYGDEAWDEINLIGQLNCFEGIAHLVHTTRKHTDEKPRFRIVLPLARDITKEEFKPVVLGCAEMLDAEMRAVSTESFAVAQVMFLPTVCKGAPYFAQVFNGDFLDPDTLLKQYPADDSTLWPQHANGHREGTYIERRMTHPEEKRHVAPIITAVCRAFTPEEFIDEFLDDYYSPGGENRWTYNGASGAPSVRIYDEYFVQSDHGTDPANGQHNIFDLGRIHLFQNLDDGHDLDRISFTEYPSFKAMSDFMLENGTVREIYDEIIEENEAEKTEAIAAALDLLDDLDDEEGPDEDDDLIGETDKPKKRRTLESLLTAIRKRFENAKTLNALVELAEKIAAIPTEDFKGVYRTLLSEDLQREMARLGHKVAKADAAKMLKPTIANLRDQQRDKPMPDFLKDWVYIAGRNVFRRAGSSEELSKEGFDGQFGVDTGQLLGFNDKGLPEVRASEAALNIWMVPKAHALMFDPREDSLFEVNGIPYLNSFVPLSLPEDNYRGNEGVKLLKRMLADLFPDKKHQSMMLDFLAHCITKPGEKLRYAMLVKGAEGEGKSLLFSLIQNLSGPGSAGIIGTKQLKKEFNGWAEGKTACAIEEIKITGREAYEVLNDLKPVVTNDTISIEKKGVDVTTCRNFCNLYLTTNYEDSMPMAADNSRYLVLFTGFRNNEEVRAWRNKRIAEEGEDYVQKLFEHIEKYRWQFLRFFQRYSFSKWYKPKDRAPDTEFKTQMAQDSKSEEHQLLDSIIAEGKHLDITEDVLRWSSFATEMEVRGLGNRIRGAGIGAFMRSAGFIKGESTMMLDKQGKTNVKIWTKRSDFVQKNGNLSEEGRLAVRDILLEMDAQDEEV